MIPLIVNAGSHEAILMTAECLKLAALKDESYAECPRLALNPSTFLHIAVMEYFSFNQYRGFNVQC